MTDHETCPECHRQALVDDGLDYDGESWSSTLYHIWRCEHCGYRDLTLAQQEEWYGDE